MGDAFQNWQNDVGFGGEIWACFDEFVWAEYLDADYMERILTPAEFEQWKKTAGKTINLISRGGYPPLLLYFYGGFPKIAIAFTLKIWYNICIIKSKKGKYPCLPLTPTSCEAFWRSFARR